MRTPLGVLSRVQPAEGGLSLLALALAASCLGLVASVSAPLALQSGVAISLDNRTIAATPVRVATSATPDLARVGAVATLVSARGAGTYVIEGRILQGRDALLAELRRVASNPSRRAMPVLVKAERTQTLQGLADILGAARAAGFPGILLATETR